MSMPAWTVPACAIGLCLVLMVPYARGQDNERRAEDVLDSISGSLGVLELSELSEAVEVSADHLDYDYRSGRILCHGNVVVTQGEVSLRASELKIVPVRSGTKTFRRITAHGDVSVTNGRATASGNTAVYDQGDGRITLRGGAQLASENKSVSGEKVVFNLDEGRARIESGKQPVRAVIETGDRNKDGGPVKHSGETKQ